jgi:SAM-dependent methyltransferase
LPLSEKQGVGSSILPLATMRDANYPPNYKLSNLSDKNLINFLMEKPHTYIGKKYKDFKGDVIEFGCGDGNNIKYFNSYNSYTFSDYEFKLFDEQNILNENTYKIKFDLIKDSYDQISNKYDLFLLFHTLEHIINPHEVLESLFNALKPGGIIELIQPNDPSIVWNTGEWFGSFKANVDKKTYYYHQAREHVNPIKNLDRLIKYYFDDITIRDIPFRLNVLNLKLFRIYTIRKP